MLTGLSGSANYIASASIFAGIGMGLATTMALVGLVLKLGGGLGLLLGIHTRHAALALILFTVLATIMFHLGETTAGLKNLAIIGGLFYVLAAGPGAWTLKQFNRDVVHRSE